ncbi:flavin reductase family protein [Actinophytocola sp.]|uniref:flavin reductase family protein n=1 Tax=Actinophytocola sp. TaxID=1872138 RepID=UPI002D67C4B2|nr:flavin reductase family protein [Actinophytocola sp.]HYQ69136.1 flavin reductase family protein [Actinophytocola sp.]
MMVATTADRAGWWWGCPVTALTPVPAEPSRVTIGIPRDAEGYRTFTTADAVAVHVLRAGQEALADHLARHPTDFDTVQSTHGFRVDCGFGGVPLLAGVVSRLECRPVNVVTAGGRVLLLAQVVRDDCRGGLAA